MRKIEILAPAGSYEGMKAAMNAGCDAVYIGGSSFGARAYANNPDQETLLQAIDEAHLRDKKLYLTVNTLLKEKELAKELYSFLDKLYLQGLDAVIVQDVGVMHFIHRSFPDLMIHASTQMTLTMAQGANLLKDYGVTRLVTSRELSLREIKAIRDNTDMEIETFVHGALCYCYSGQCLMSSIIGARSGNRGRCAQPCRMPYQFYSEDKKLSGTNAKYLLSPKDINSLRIIPELIKAGVDSFKIEGRMKRPEYAAAVAHMYRKYVDLYFELGDEKYDSFLQSDEHREDIINLQDVYNRGGFSEGYGKQHNGKSMMSLYRPNHSGVLVGEVLKIEGSRVSIKLRERINAQDILEIRHQEEEGYEFTVKDPHEPGDILVTNVGRRPTGQKKEPGKDTQGKRNDKSMDAIFSVRNPVYRTKNNQLLESLHKDYIEKDKKLGIKGLLKAKLGDNLALTLSYGDIRVTEYQDKVAEALKQPMTREKLIAPIEKTGDTLYYFEEVIVDADDNIFVPVAWLNEIRRQAINSLQEAIVNQYRRDGSYINNLSKLSMLRENDAGGRMKDSEGQANNEGNQAKEEFIKRRQLPMEIKVSVQTMEQFNTALTYPEVTAILPDYDFFQADRIPELAERAKKKGKSFYLCLPPILRQAQFEGLKNHLCDILENDSIDGFLVRNFEEIGLLQSLIRDKKEAKEVILNHNMYIYNKEAKAFWNEQGITHFTAPLELNYGELKQLGIEDCDMVVYGHLPLMVSAQCLFESTKGCRSCKDNNRGFLTDRLGKRFFLQANCRSCYNIIYNGQPLSLHKQVSEIKSLNPVGIRLDFTTEDTTRMKQILTLYSELYRYGNNNVTEIDEYTTGHFKRGVE